MTNNGNIFAYLYIKPKNKYDLFKIPLKLYSNKK